MAKAYSQPSVKDLALKETLLGAAVSFGIGIISYILTFVFKVLCARYFGPSDFGTYEFVNTILNIVLVVISLGIPTALVRAYSEYLITQKKSLLNGYVRFAISSQILISTVVIVLLITCSNILSNYFDMGSRFSFFISVASIALIFKALNGVLSQIFIARKDTFNANLGLQVIEKIVLVICTTAIVWLHLDLSFLIYSLVLASFVSFMYYILKYNSSRNEFEKLDNGKKSDYMIKDWLLFSIPLMLVNILGMVMSWTDQFVIARYLDSASIGIYGIAASLANYVYFVPTAILSIFIPVLMSLYQKDKVNFLKVFERVRTWSFCAAMFFGFVLIFFARQVILILFGNDFIAAENSTVILAVAFIVCSYFVAYDQMLIVLKKSKYLLFNSLFFVFVNLIGNIIVISNYGTIESVAYVSAFSLIFSRVLVYFVTNKIEPHKLHLKPVFKIIILGLLSIICVKILFVYLLNNVPISVFLKLILAVIVYVGSFVLLIYVTKSLNHDDKSIILAIVHRVGLQNNWLVKSIIKRYSHNWNTFKFD